jgi:hypothetical protein
MKSLILIGLAALGLAACGGPVLDDKGEVVRAFPGAPYVVHPTGPYDNTPNSLGGGFVGGGGNG